MSVCVRGAVALWFGVLAGPTAYAVVFLLTLALDDPACLYGFGLVRLAAVGGAALVTVAAGAASWRRWGVLMERVPEGAGGLPGGERLLAFAGVALSIMALLLLAAHASALPFLDPCTAG